METIAELCIVCDEVSKEAANGLCNKLCNRHNCIVCTENEYPKYKTTTTFKTISNTQKILYLSNKLIQEYLPDSMWEESSLLTEGTKLVRIGNQYGILIDDADCNSIPFLTGKDWWKYLISLVSTGIISFPIALVLWRKRKKKAEMKKKKLYLDAIKYIVGGDNIKKLFPER